MVAICYKIFYYAHRAGPYYGLGVSIGTRGRGNRYPMPTENGTIEETWAIHKM